MSFRHGDLCRSRCVRRLTWPKPSGTPRPTARIIAASSGRAGVLLAVKPGFGASSSMGFAAVGFVRWALSGTHGTDLGPFWLFFSGGQGHFEVLFQLPRARHIGLVF